MLKELEIVPRAVVMTDQRNPVVSALAGAFIHEWPRAGQPPIEEWPFRNDSEQSDFAANLVKLGQTVALFAGTSADFLKLQTKLLELKINATLLYGGEDVGLGALRKPGVEALTATVFVSEGFTEEGKEFAKRYEERFHEPPGFDAVQAYDAGRLLVTTMLPGHGQSSRECARNFHESNPSRA